MNITITDADFETALGADFADGKEAWRLLRERARHAAACRLLEENQARQRAIIAECDALDTTKPDQKRRWWELQSEITTVFGAHRALMAEAFPGSEPAEEATAHADLSTIRVTHYRIAPPQTAGSFTSYPQAEVSVVLDDGRVESLPDVARVFLSIEPGEPPKAFVEVLSPSLDVTTRFYTVSCSHPKPVSFACADPEVSSEWCPDCGAIRSDRKTGTWAMPRLGRLGRNV